MDAPTAFRVCPFVGGPGRDGMAGLKTFVLLSGVAVLRSAQGVLYIEG